MKQLFVLASVFALTSSVALQSRTAHAQEEAPLSPSEGASAGYPSNFTQRPITLPAMTLKGDLAFAAIHLGGAADNGFLLNLGGAFGILDDLEVGVSGDRQGLNNGVSFSALGGIAGNGLVPFVLAPDFDFGDIYLYGRYRFLNTDSFQLGVELGVNIPTSTNFGLVVAAPFRLRLGEFFSLDGGIEFLTLLTDPDATFALRATLQPRLAPVDFLYFGVDLGVGFGFGNGDPIAIPFGFEAGYVIDLDKIKIDAYLNFSFPVLYGSLDIGPGGRQGDTAPEFWQLLVGARAFIGLGE